MQISTFLIDWTEATERAEDGTLSALAYGHDLEDEAEDADEEEEEEEVEDEADEDEAEEGASKLWSDNYTVYSHVADAYVQIADHLEGDFRQRCDRLMNAIISRNPAMELQALKLSDGWLMSLAPETIEELAGLADEIDFKELKKTFNSKCSRETKRALAEHAKLPDPNRAFDLVFIPYVEGWVELIRQGADEEKGLLAIVG